MKPQSSNAKAIRKTSHVQTTITSIHSTQVVMKIVQANCTNLDYMRLKREVEVLTQIQNDRFPRVLDQFENATRFGVVEEYIPGQKLNEWIETKPTKKQRILIFIQILDLVEILHQNGFLHMGIQVEDLLIQNEKVYLTNFKDCLPIGSLRPLIDSKIELPLEALKGMPLEISSDQISLAKIYEQFVGRSLWLKKAKATNIRHRFSSLMTWKKLLQISLYQHQIWFVLISGLVLIAILTLVLKSFVLESHFNSSPLTNEKLDIQVSQSAPMSSESSQQSQPISNSATSDDGGIQDSQDNLCIEIYETLAKNPQQVLDLKAWTSYAKIALDQSYLPLAGYLLDHVPPGSFQSSFEFQMYEFELSVFCQKENDDSLNWLLLNLCDQPDWDQLFCQLLECLLVHQITVDKPLVEELIQQLEQQVPLSNALCINLLNYILFLQSEQTSLWQIPDSVANDLQVHAPELYGLLLKTQIE